MQKYYTVVSLVALLVAVAAFVLLRNRDTYERDMRAIHAIIDAGEQNWGTEATAQLHKMMARSEDRHALADRLLNEANGSLVAEGMVLVVQSQHPRARDILQKHLSDTRWNWALANNDELAQQLLLYLDKQPTEQWVLNWLSRTAAAN